MILTRHTIEQIESRIERAYYLRFPGWSLAGLDPRLWSAAASILTDAHRSMPWIPLDPELFVACQIGCSEATDPWRALTRAASRQRYIDCLNKIVKSLRKELRGELKRIEAAVFRGDSLEQILFSPTRRLSPLGRYLASIQFDRPDLSEQLDIEARAQYVTCSLYQKACEELLPGRSLGLEPVLPESIESSSSYAFSLN